MKILHIVPSYKPAYIYGGTVESVARLCEGLAQAGNEVCVYTTTANGSKELDVMPGKTYIVDGVKVIYFKRQTNDPSHVSLSLYKQLYKSCREFDIVHIHSWWNILVIISALICKMRKVKTVFSPHGMLSDYILSNSNSSLKRLTNAIFGKNLLKYMILHTTSISELTECRQLITGWKGFVIPNILWLPDLKLLKRPSDQFTILFLSRIHPKKGIELLMEAVSAFADNICMKIAGSGEKQYITALKKKAQALKMENKIQWLGWKAREEKFKVLIQADLFALTSYNENFGNVVIEALHVGTPVLITEGVGLSEFIQQHDFGWICKPEPGDIKQQLAKAIHDKRKRNRIATAAPGIIQLHFSAAVLIPQYQSLYSA